MTLAGRAKRWISAIVRETDADGPPDGRERLLRRVFWGLVLLATLVRASNAIVYDVGLGHDSRSHDQYLTAVLHGGRIRNRVEYCLPQSYLWTAVHGWAMWPGLHGDEARLHHVALGLGNLHLYGWMVLGLLALARRAGLSGSARAAFVAVTVTSPVVQRSLDILRPENLILAFFPWILAAALRIEHELPERLPGWRTTVAFGALLGLVASEKIGGLSIVLALGAGLLVLDRVPFRRKLAAVFLLGAATAAFATPLFVAHRVLVGRWFFQHPTFTDRRLGDAYDHRAPGSFYWPVRLGHIWEHPVREEQRGSMWGILLSDLHGDYWQYGVQHKRFPIAAAERLSRQRQGLLATAVFLALLVTSIVLLARRARAGPQAPVARAVLVQLLLQVGGALAYMAVTCQVGFDPPSANLIKWEYVGWCIPMTILPMAVAASAVRKRGSGLLLLGSMVALSVFGLAQSLVIPR